MPQKRPQTRHCNFNSTFCYMKMDRHKLCHLFIVWLLKVVWDVTDLPFMKKDFPKHFISDLKKYIYIFGGRGHIYALLNAYKLLRRKKKKHFWNITLLFHHSALLVPLCDFYSPTFKIGQPWVFFCKCDMWAAWMGELGMYSPCSNPAARHTEAGNGQPLWWNSIGSPSTVKKIESCGHLGRFNGVNIHTVELHDLSCSAFCFIESGVKSVTSPESIWLEEMDGH